MGLQIPAYEIDWKIDDAYEEENYAKVNQLLEMKKKLFGDYK